MTLLKSRTFTLTSLVIKRRTKRLLRFFIAGSGIAIAVLSFTLARYLATGGSEELDETIATTQGVAATIQVDMTGKAAKDQPTIDRLIDKVELINGSKPTVVYQTSTDVACPGSTSPITASVLEGPLLPLTGEPTSTADLEAGISVVTLLEQNPMESLCFPEQVRPARSLNLPSGPWDQLGLQTGSVYIQGGNSPIVDRLQKESDHVTLFLVAEPEQSGATIKRIETETAILLELTPATENLEVTVVRADRAEDFADTQQTLSVVLTTMGLLGLAAGVAGVITTELASLPIKLRFLALCRAIGASTRDVTTMAFIEGAATVGIGALLGIALSVVIVVLGGPTLSNVLGTPINATSPAPVIQALLACIPAVVLAGLIPARMAKNDIIKAAREL